MTPEVVMSFGRDALLAVLIISAPMLLGSLLIGLIVSIFQATTQIQEATLAFIPKIVVVLLMALFFGPWMLKMLVQYAGNLIGSLHEYTFIR